MVIFNSYVKLPEGKWINDDCCVWLIYRYTKIEFQQRMWIFKPNKNRDDNLRTAGFEKCTISAGFEAIEGTACWKWSGSIPSQNVAKPNSKQLGLVDTISYNQCGEIRDGWFIHLLLFTTWTCYSHHSHPFSSVQSSWQHILLGRDYVYIYISIQTHP